MRERRQSPFTALSYRLLQYTWAETACTPAEESDGHSWPGRLAAISVKVHADQNDTHCVNEHGRNYTATFRHECLMPFIGGSVSQAESCSHQYVANVTVARGNVYRPRAQRHENCKLKDVPALHDDKRRRGPEKLRLAKIGSIFEDVFVEPREEGVRRDHR